MKKRTWILALAIVLLEAGMMWTSWHANDWMTCILMGVWMVCLVGLIVNLIACRAQWTFRIPALVLVAGYVAWHGWNWWQFLTNVD